MRRAEARRSRRAALAALAVVFGAALACAAPGGEEAGWRGRLEAVAPGAGPPERVVLVTVAGLTAERYAPEAGGSGRMPVLSALAREGVAALRVEPVTPPVPYVVHTTLVTGRPADEHGVVADRLLGERGVRAARHPHASRIRGETLWQQVASAGASVAALDWPATRGATIPLLLPDEAPSRRGETWLGRLEGSATPWLLQLARERFGEGPGAPPGAERDAFLVEAACRALEGEAQVRLLLARLRGPEAALRRSGPDSPEAHAAFARADAEIGRLLGCLREAGRLAGTALVVAGDRGLAPLHTAVRPNRLLAEAGLVRAEGGRVRSWSALARSNGGSAFVYARDAEAALAARRALAEAAGRTGAFRVLSAQVMLGRNADPEAWFGLDAEPGFAFADGAGGPVLEAAAARAAGGYVGDGVAPAPGWVAWGAGLRRGLRVPRMHQLDVAPTLAALLGVELPDARGRTLVGLLRAGRAAAGGGG